MPRLTSLSIELLETFLALVHHEGDAGETARELKINQPSISKRLANLQHAGEVIKRPWIKREGKTWLLTDEGERVLPVVQELLDRYRSLKGFTAAMASRETAVQFGCGPIAAIHLVRKALESFKVNHPEESVRISTMRAEQRITGVANGALDMALVGRSPDEIRRIARVDLHIEEVARYGYGLVCSPKSVWASEFQSLPAQKPVQIKALHKFPLIVTDPGSRTRQILDRAAAGETPLSMPVQTGSWATILDYVRDGHGVGVVSEAVFDRDSKQENLLYRSLDPRRLPPATLQLVCRVSLSGIEGMDLTPTGLAWRETLRRAANAPDPSLPGWREFRDAHSTRASSRLSH